MGTLDMRPAEMRDNEVKPADEAVEETSTSEDSETEISNEEETSEKTKEDEVEESETTEEEPKNNDEIEQESDDEDEKKVIGLKAEEERLRSQIVELRKERREIKSQPIKEESLIVEDLKDVAEADIQVIEKVLKAKGYVKKDEIDSMTYTERLETYKNDWLEKHPEYLPENDPDDKNWNALQKEINTFYKAPADPKKIMGVLERAHRELKGTSLMPQRKSSQTLAAKEKLKVNSMAGKGGGTKQAPKIKSNLDKSYLKGFTEEELEELGI